MQRSFLFEIVIRSTNSETYNMVAFSTTKLHIKSTHAVKQTLLPYIADIYIKVTIGLRNEHLDPLSLKSRVFSISHCKRTNTS